MSNHNKKAKRAERTTKKNTNKRLDKIERDIKKLKREQEQEKPKPNGKGISILFTLVFVSYILYIVIGYIFYNSNSDFYFNYSDIWKGLFLILSYLLVPALMTWGTAKLVKDRKSIDILLIIIYSILIIFSIVFYIITDYSPIETGLRALFIPVVISIVSIYSK